MKTGCRGEALTIVVIILGALGLTQVVPNWRITHLFSKGSGTKELRAAQDAAAKAAQEAAEAKSKYETALLEQRTKTVQQSQYSQQMIHGIPIALARAPQTAEVVFASSLAERASKGLQSAIGELPVEKQAEIAFIVQQALSAKQAEVDAAKAALAAKDKELAIVTAEKKTIEAKIPELDAKATAAEQKAIAADGLVVVKTNEVAVYAEKMAEKEQENGSLGTLLHKLFWVFGVLTALYLFVHFILPSLAQEFPGSRVLVGVNKTAKSIFSSHI